MRNTSEQDPQLLADGLFAQELIEAAKQAAVWSDDIEQYIGQTNPAYPVCPQLGSEDEVLRCSWSPS